MNITGVFYARTGGTLVGRMVTDSYSLISAPSLSSITTDSL